MVIIVIKRECVISLIYVYFVRVHSFGNVIISNGLARKACERAHKFLLIFSYRCHCKTQNYFLFANSKVGSGNPSHNNKVFWFWIPFAYDLHLMSTKRKGYCHILRKLVKACNSHHATKYMHKVWNKTSK